MSQDRPLSPIQPRVVTSATQVQQWPPIFGASYLGRPDRREIPALPLPATQPGHYQHPTSCDKSKPAQFELPPIRTPTTRSSTESNRLENPLAIANLLSSRPSSRKRTERQISSSVGDFSWSDHEAKTTSPHRNPSANCRGSPTNSQPRITSYQSAPTYHSNGIPVSWRQEYRATSKQTHHTSSRSELDEFKHSPASTERSVPPSYYSGSSEASPSSSGAPVYKQVPIPTVSQPPPLNYNLNIRQQPIAARACGFGERDRRVIDPPPILELKITDKVTGAPEQDPNAMLALHCTLVDAEANENDTQAETAYIDVPSARRLMGTLVASPYQAKDEKGVAGTFFVFSDLSCRISGRYRLHFKLLRVDPMLMMPGVVHGSVASTESDVFSVYTAKEFPGMRASTALLTALRGQGLNVGLKKGTEGRTSKGRKRKGSVSSEDNESESDDERRLSNESGKTYAH